MSLPSYVDLTKRLQELFSIGYNFGKVAISTQNSASEAVEFNANGSQDIEDSSVTSDLLVKFNHLCSCVYKWSSNNNVSKEVTFQDILTPGLKLGGVFQYNLDSQVKNWNAQGQYKLANCTLDCSIDGEGESSSLFLNGSIVAGLRGFVTGCECKFDTGEGKMIASSLTCGYLDPGASYLLVRVDSRGLITGSYFQQVTPCLELGVVSMPNSEDGPKMDIATKFALSPQVLTLRGKVNNRSELGVGCDFQVVKGMTLSFSSAIDLKTFNSGSHKFGIGLAFAQ